jgi:predicted RNase H-like HicB family nuclease
LQQLLWVELGHIEAAHGLAPAGLFVYNGSMSHKQRFLVNLVFDPEYQGYVADVPQLPGCMSQGKSVEAALRNVRKAIKVYLKDEPQTDLEQLPEVLTSQVEVRM